MNTADTVRAQSRKDPAQLEHEIDQQRDHIADIVQALENKLSPGQVFDRILGSGKHGSREFAGNLAETVKANPMPTLLTVAGLAWLYASHGERGSVEASDSPGLGERVGHAREGVSSKVGSARQKVGESAHHAADVTRAKARRANEGFQHMLDDNPMALGAMGIAAGALLGAMLPSTRREDELLGPVRDRFADQARHAVHSGYEAAAETGREVTGPTDGSGAAARPGDLSPEEAARWS